MNRSAGRADIWKKACQVATPEPLCRDRDLHSSSLGFCDTDRRKETRVGDKHHVPIAFNILWKL